jgi:hypothetical protein
MCVICVNEIVESKGSYFLVVFNVLYKYFVCFYNSVKLMVILRCLSDMQKTVIRNVWKIVIAYP